MTPRAPARSSAHPKLKWTTSELEYTRYGFRKLIEERTLDIVQPDVMWVGGMTELWKIAAHGFLEEAAPWANKRGVAPRPTWMREHQTGRLC